MKYLIQLYKNHQRAKKLKRLYDLTSQGALTRRDTTMCSSIMEPKDLVYYCSPEAWELATELNVVSVYGVRLVPAMATKITA